MTRHRKIQHKELKMSSHYDPQNKRENDGKCLPTLRIGGVTNPNLHTWERVALVFSAVELKPSAMNYFIMRHKYTLKQD